MFHQVKHFGAAWPTSSPAHPPPPCVSASRALLVLQRIQAEAEVIVILYVLKQFNRMRSFSSEIYRFRTARSIHHNCMLRSSEKPILLYGLEAVTMSNANLRTLYVAWKTALYKNFKLTNDANLLYTQYCFGVLPINFVSDLRKLCFLSKQRCHSISVHNVFYDIFGFYEFNRLCSVVYSVCGQSCGYFSASVWDVFRALVFWLLYWLYCFSSGLSVCLSLHIVVWIKITKVGRLICGTV